MDSAVIPAEVARFIADHIDTVPHLEALLLMWESAPRRWSAAEIAARVYVGEELAGSILQGLAQRRLIAADGDGEPLYRYEPTVAGAAELVPQLSATYRRHLVRVASLIHAKASTPMLEFARAFKLKKDRH